MPYGSLYLKPGKSLRAALLYDSILRERYIFILIGLQSFIIYKYCYYLIEIIFRISRFFKMFLLSKLIILLSFVIKFNKYGLLFRNYWAIWWKIFVLHNGEKEIRALCLVIYCIKASEYFFSSVSNSNLGCTRFEVEHISCNLHLSLFKTYTQAYFLFYERLYIDCTFFSKKS